MMRSRYLKMFALAAVTALTIATLPGPVRAAGNSAGTGQGSGSTTYGNQHTGVFSDIATHWARADIEALHAQGIIAGDGTGRFYPDRNISMAELIKMLVAVAKLPPASATGKPSASLSGLDPTAWYYPYVSSAVSAGVIRSTEGTFRPNGATPRELLAVWVVRAAGKESLAPAGVSAASGFADYSQISSWARGYVGMAKNLGLVQGYGGSFLPKTLVTRAEAATMIMRLIRLDQTPATVRVSRTASTSVTLSFTEPVDRVTAEVAANYEITGLQVKAAKLQIDGKTVVLTTAPQAAGRSYQIKVKNVRDLAWNVTATSAMPLAPSAGPVPAKVVYKDAVHVEIPFDKVLAPDATVQVKVVNAATGATFGSPYMLEADGKTLKLMLSAEMAPGSTYAISLAGVRDQTGAEMEHTVLSFRAP